MSLSVEHLYTNFWKYKSRESTKKQKNDINVIYLELSFSWESYHVQSS